MRIYWFYRPDYIGTINYTNLSLNWKYTMSFYIKKYWFIR